MAEDPFDIDIRSIKHHASLSDKVPSAALAGVAPDSRGVSASLFLKDDQCRIQSASGVFKIKRVWTTKVTSSADNRAIDLRATHGDTRLGHPGPCIPFLVTCAE